MGGPPETTTDTEALTPGCVTDVAVMVVLPDASPFTKPSAFTVATPGLLEVQVKLLHPVRSALPASSGVAVSCVVAPMERFCVVAGVSVALATTGGTNASVLTRAAALRATLNLAICCASMML